MYHLSAAQRYTVGLHNLGLCFLERAGASYWPEQGVKFIRMAAELGDSYAQTCLGLCCLSYLSVFFFLFLLNIWDPGECYWDGEGVPTNAFKAMDYFLQAASQVRHF